MSPTTSINPIGLPDGRIRVVIENVEPSVDGGRFPIKRIVGDVVEVEADCFADGHDVVACVLQWRRSQAEPWNSAAMRPLVNDRWRASFVVDAIGPYQYTIRAWVDPFQSWQRDYLRRVDADDLRVAAATGAELIGQTATRAGRSDDSTLLRAWSRELAQAAVVASSVADVAELKRLGTDESRCAMARSYPDLRQSLMCSQIFDVTVERARARFSAWYEFFPRSASEDPLRHGSFADCEAWLPYVKRLGFDVVYFPPIHTPKRRPTARTPSSAWSTWTRTTHKVAGSNWIWPRLACNRARPTNCMT